jgi:hypothetical protein
MKVSIETGEHGRIELRRSGDAIVMACIPADSERAVLNLDINEIAELHSALGMFGAQISPGEPEGDPESPWQVGTRFRFTRGVYKGIDLTIIDMRDDGEETEYMIASDSRHVLHSVRRRDLDAAAVIID